MNNPTNDTNYRVLYGKLFSALISQFGVQYTSEVEDAIQNSFLKSIKIWKPNCTPKKKDDWLYITTRNDLLNQLKRNKKSSVLNNYQTVSSPESKESDLRLETILLVASSKTISKQAQIVFVLKNIFGLNVREISESTLLGKDAIYKIIGRTKTSLQKEFKNRQPASISKGIRNKAISIVEETLYAVFNTGFDSFNKKHKSIINEDLCLESFSLVKLLLREYNKQSTGSLLALFCLHIARIPAKVNEGKLVSFFNQDRDKWNKELINLGFHYLKQPDKIDKFYVEALIASKYMSANSFTIAFWNDIIRLYEILLRLSASPVAELNYCFCLYKAQRKKEAIALLKKIETKLPSGHIYLSLIKANFLNKINPEESQKISTSVTAKMNQEIRKKYLLENQFINL